MSDSKQEVWKDIPGYEGYYQASNIGNIRSLDRLIKNGKGKIRIPCRNKVNGYLMVSLYKKRCRRNFPIHTLVLSTFSGIRPRGFIARHLDGNKLNNTIDNLKWGTYEQNIEDARKHGVLACGEKNGHAKLTDQDIRQIRKLYAGTNMTQSDIAKVFKTARNNITRIINYTRWKHIK